MRLYKGKYKYITDEDEIYETGIKIAEPIDHELFNMSTEGRLIVFTKYAYDGPSGPTIDTKLFIWISLPHDVGYQMIRMGLLNEDYRKIWDEYLYVLALQGKPATDTTKRLKPMWKLRAKWVYRGVRLGGEAAADPKNRRKPMIF